MSEALIHLTFQHHDAREAVDFYVSLLPDSEVRRRTPVGVGRDLIEFTLLGRRFLAVDSPPIHDWDFSPAASIYLEMDTPEELDRTFAALSEGGQVHMPVDDYGFNPHFGWCQDRFGVSWQLGVR